MKIAYKTLKKPPTEVSNLNTVVFIDYESFCISFKKQYGVPPPLDTLFDEFKDNGRIMKIKVFGDFTKDTLLQERNRIRTLTSDVIDCSYESDILKKDFTDFIMLDHIYQEVIQNPAVEQYIFFTGDGHFSSVATFLRTFMGKAVGIYAVINSLSQQLKDCASWVKLYYSLDDMETQYKINLLKCLQRAHQNGKIPTFSKTIEHTMRIFGGDYYKYESALSNLMEENYIRREICDVYKDGVFNMLVVDWERVAKDFFEE